MKTLKNFITVLVLTFSLTSFATNGDNVTTEENVTITNTSNTVAISILNTENNSYKLYIYSENGDLVFKSLLGSKTSLGQAFDFNTAEAGTYIFKVVSDEGTITNQKVVIG